MSLSAWACPSLHLLKFIRITTNKLKYWCWTSFFVLPWSRQCLSKTRWLNFISSLWTSLYHTAFYKKRTALVWPFWLFSYIYFQIGKQLLTDLLFQLPKESQSPPILCLHTRVIIYYSFPKTQRNNSVPLVITRLICEHCCTYQHIDLNQKNAYTGTEMSVMWTNKTEQNKTKQTRPTLTLLLPPLGFSSSQVEVEMLHSAGVKGEAFPVCSTSRRAVFPCLGGPITSIFSSLEGSAFRRWARR